METDTAFVRASDGGMLNAIALENFDMTVVHFYGNGNFQLSFGVFEHNVLVGRKSHHFCRVFKHSQHILVRIVHVGNQPFKDI